jgi:hypothetical protein
VPLLGATLTPLWIALAVVAAFAAGWMARVAIDLWRNLKALKSSMAEARDQVREALVEVNEEVRRATESLGRIRGEEQEERPPRE